MRKQRKRIYAALLCICMVLSLVSTPVSAAETGQMANTQEHAAEFYNLDASHGYQLYKLLHDARVRRRKCKNAIAWIDYILEQALDRFIENDPSPRIAGTRSRDYAPRALPALFEWENEGQTPTANLCP